MGTRGVPIVSAVLQYGEKTRNVDYFKPLMRAVSASVLKIDRKEVWEDLDTRHVFGEKKWVGTFKQSYTFELISFFGHIFEFFRRKTTKGMRYVHIGCGNVLLDNFLNVDFYSPKMFVKRLMRMEPRSKLFRGHDFRHKLPFMNQVFDGAFSEHTLEHLDPWHAKRLLKEIHRVLRPGSVIRIVVPNLDHYVKYYSGEMPDPAFAKFAGGAEAIWCLTQNWGHQSVWNFANLSKCLAEAGFQDISQVSFQSGSNPDLLRDLSRRRWESLYVEARA
jgi:predicted SAM-dependent methyltransferase